MVTFTTAADLLDAEILAPIIQNKYANAMSFLPLAMVDRTLEGKPGDTLTQPIWKPLGKAQKVNEGEDIPVEKGSQGLVRVTVEKYAHGYAFTDESDISRVGNQVQYGTSEIANSIAQYSDDSLMNAGLAVKNTMTVDPTVLGLDALIGSFKTQKTGGAFSVICSPTTKLWFDKDLLEYTKGSETGANIVLNGAVPTLFGASFFTTNKMADGKAVVVYSSADDIKQLKALDSPKAEDPFLIESTNTGQAFKLVMKRDLLVETERKPGNQTNYIYGSQIAGAYVQNPSKVLVATINKPTDSPTSPKQ